MENILSHLKIIDQTDTRQQSKIKYPLSEIIALSFFAITANADDCVDIANFGKEHQTQLKEIPPLKHGIPSHDTICRAFTIVSPEYLQSFQHHFNQLLNNGEGEKIRKILALDGKTQCGNGNNQQKANHIVSAVDKAGFCLNQEIADDKSNEISALPKLLNSLNIKNNIITMDALGTQRDLAGLIRKKRADYVLALKRNQKSLYEEISLCFEDPTFLDKCNIIRRWSVLEEELSRGSIGNPITLVGYLCGRIGRVLSQLL